MNKDDWKKRFLKEYKETKERYSKLHKFLVDYDAGAQVIKPRTKIRVLRKQAKAMGEYLYCLEVRAVAEGIELKGE